MTYWKEQTAKELISQMENEVQQMLKLKIRPRPPYIISKYLYDKLKKQENKDT